MTEQPPTYPPPSYDQVTPPPERHPPKVLHNQPHPSGVVRVTFALPGLRRAVLTVPEAGWQRGEHLPAGPELAALVGEVDRQEAAIGARVLE